MRSRLGRGPPSLFSESRLFFNSAWGYPAPPEQAVGDLCPGPSATSSSQGFEGLVGESAVWPGPSYHLLRVKLPTEGLRGI